MSDPGVRRRRATRLALLVLAAGFLAGVSLGSAGLLPVPELSVRWSMPALSGDEYAPTGSTEPGEQLLLVYVGSSTCGWSNRPELPGMIRRLKGELSSRAAAAGTQFAAIGVARDRKAEDGLAHLEKFGPFDEVLAGQGWANTGIQEYIYGAADMAGPGVTPQLIVLSRRLDYSVGHVAAKEQRVLLRKTGLGNITEWVEAGAPFEGDSPSAAAYDRTEADGRTEP